MKFLQNDPQIDRFWKQRMFENDYIYETWHDFLDELLKEASVTFLENSEGFFDPNEIFPEVDTE